MAARITHPGVVVAGTLSRSIQDAAHQERIVPRFNYRGFVELSSNNVGQRTQSKEIDFVVELEADATESQRQETAELALTAIWMTSPLPRHDVNGTQVNDALPIIAARVWPT